MSFFSDNFKGCVTIGNSNKKDKFKFRYKHKRKSVPPTFSHDDNIEKILNNISPETKEALIEKRVIREITVSGYEKNSDPIFLNEKKQIVVFVTGKLGMEDPSSVTRDFRSGSYEKINYNKQDSSLACLVGISPPRELTVVSDLGYSVENDYEGGISEKKLSLEMPTNIHKGTINFVDKQAFISEQFKDSFFLIKSKEILSNKYISKIENKSYREGLKEFLKQNNELSLQQKNFERDYFPKTIGDLTRPYHPRKMNMRR